MAAVPQFTAPFPSSAVAEPTYASALPSWLAPVGSLLDRFEAARERLNLPEPGKHEDLGREVKRACTPLSLSHCHWAQRGSTRGGSSG